MQSSVWSIFCSVSARPIEVLAGFGVHVNGEEVAIDNVELLAEHFAGAPLAPARQSDPLRAKLRSANTKEKARRFLGAGLFRVGGLQAYWASAFSFVPLPLPFFVLPLPFGGGPPSG